MKKLLTVAAIICTVFFVVACDSVFSKIQIKASPELYAPLGGRNLEVSKYISVEKISDFFGKVSQDSKLKIYDYMYNDTNDIMTFLAYYPLMEIPVDFSEYLKELDLGSELSVSLNDISFTVPELSADVSGASQFVAVPYTSSYAGKTLDAQSAQAVNSAIAGSGNIPVSSINVPVSGGASFRSAVIKTGSVSLIISPTVSGLSLNASGIKIKLPGSADELSFTQTSAGNYTLDLAGKTIESGNLSIAGNVTVGGSVSAGDVVPLRGLGADVSCTVSIQELQSATIAFDQNLSVDIERSIPLEVVELISEVKFKSNPGLGMKIQLTNQLPAGMDVSVTLDSADLGISNKTESFPVSATPTEKTIANTANPVIQPSSWTDNKLSISAKIGLPADMYDETNKLLTVSNIVAGKTYSLSGSIALLAAFESITLNPGSRGAFSGVYPESGQVDLSSFMNKLPAGIELADNGLEANLYLSSPIPADKLSVTGLISADTNAGTTYLLGAAGSPEDIVFGNSLSLPRGSSWTTPLPEPSVLFGQKLVEFINDKPQSVTLNYDLGLNHVTITEADLTGGKVYIKAELLLKIPIALKINGTDQSPDNPSEKGVSVDIFDLAGVDASKDLFGRSGPDSISADINTLLDQLTSMTLSVKYDNTLGIAAYAFIEDAATGIRKNIQLKNGSDTAKVSLHADEIKSVITSYPFAPTIKVFIPNTDSLGLKRNGGISVNLSVSAVTDIDYTYDVGGKN